MLAHSKLIFKMVSNLSKRSINSMIWKIYDKLKNLKCKNISILLNLKIIILIYLNFLFFSKNNNNYFFIRKIIIMESKKITFTSKIISYLSLNKFKEECKNHSVLEGRVNYT